MIFDFSKSYEEVVKFLRDSNQSIKYAEFETKVKITFRNNDNVWYPKVTFGERINKNGAYYNIEPERLEDYYLFEAFSTAFQCVQYVKYEYLQICDENTKVTVKIFLPYGR